MPRIKGSNTLFDLPTRRFFKLAAEDRSVWMKCGERASDDDDLMDYAIVRQIASFDGIYWRYVLGKEELIDATKTVVPVDMQFPTPNGSSKGRK